MLPSPPQMSDEAESREGEAEGETEGRAEVVRAGIEVVRVGRRGEVEVRVRSRGGQRGLIIEKIEGSKI